MRFRPIHSLGQHVVFLADDIPDEGAKTCNITLFIKSNLTKRSIKAACFQGIDDGSRFQRTRLLNCLRPSLDSAIAIQSKTSRFVVLFVTKGGSYSCGFWL